MTRDRDTVAREPMLRFSIRESAALVTTVALTVASGVAYAYATFVTRADADRGSSAIEARLDRIERKVDVLVERQGDRQGKR